MAWVKDTCLSRCWEIPDNGLGEIPDNGLGDIPDNNLAESYLGEIPDKGLGESYLGDIPDKGLPNRPSHQKHEAQQLNDKAAKHTVTFW